MKRITAVLSIFVLFVMLGGCCANSAKVQNVSCETASVAAVSYDTLQSWDDAGVKKEIIAYVKEITDKNSASYIPVEDRIAVFDNDGTLWAERPVINILYVQEKIKEKTAKEPALKNKEPYKSILSGDMGALMKMDPKVLMSVILQTQAGMTVQEYEKSVENFFTAEKYPKPNVSFDQVTYKPQIELIKYLKMHGFSVYICSGGDTDFMRVISEKYYGIPKENVIGSLSGYKYDGAKNIITREPNLVTNNDKETKPVNIAVKIGKIPVFACGNVGNSGDIAMLAYSGSSKYKSFQMLVNHDDGQREFEYGEKDNASLNAAKVNRWNVISMKSDWKNIF